MKFFRKKNWRGDRQVTAIKKERNDLEILDIKTFDILSLLINDKMSNENFSKQKLRGDCQVKTIRKERNELSSIRH